MIAPQRYELSTYGNLVDQRHVLTVKLDWMLRIGGQGDGLGAYAS